MKSTLLQIHKLSNSMDTHVPHISIFIPLDGDEGVHFSNLYTQCNQLLFKEGKDLISKYKIEWSHYKTRGYKSVALYMTHQGIVKIGLPFEVGPEYIVGDSFHVKPLFMLDDYQKRSLVLHFNSQGATLYRVSSKNFVQLESYIQPGPTEEKIWPETISGEKLRTYLRYLRAEVRRYITKDIVSIIISGLDQERLVVRDFWSFLNVETSYNFDEFHKTLPKNIITSEQFELNELIESEHAKHINDFLESRLEQELSFDFFKLGRLIQEEKIQKLYISLEDVFFGNICDETGQTTLHMQQKDTKDKDILNAFLMLCLEKNIDVKVIPKKFFPAGLSFVYS